MISNKLFFACLALVAQANSIGVLVQSDDRLLLWGTVHKNAGLDYRERLRHLRELKPQDVWIDAFDEKICGTAAFRHWQSAQSAFGCIDGPALSGSEDKNKPNQVKDYPSEIANLKEFPFFVQYKVKETNRIYNRKRLEYCPHDGSQPIACNGTEQLDHIGKCVDGKFICSINQTQSSASDNENVPYTRECNGLLVDKNLVITQDECLRGQIDTIELVFGTNSVVANNSTSNITVVRRAKKWCWQQRYLSSIGSSSRLAAIELDEPIDYAGDRVSPACLRTSQGQHLNDTVCASALKCPGEPLRSVPVMIVNAGYQMNDTYRNLDSRPLWEGCDRGGPIVCYDKCSTEDRNRVQAFAVAINWYHGAGGPGLSSAINLDSARRYLFDLLLMVQKGVKRHPFLKCIIAEHLRLEGR